MSLDVYKIREDFPILRIKVNNKDLVYFDNGATTQKPKAVLDTINNCYTAHNSNIHRGVHQLSQEMSRIYDNARVIVKDFINAEFEHEVIFTQGTTDSINTVASTFGDKFINPGDEVIVSTLEHHSNIVPWQLLCNKKGAKLRVIPINEKGEIIIEAFEKLLNEHTRIVALTHVSNALGTVVPVKQIIEMAHSHDVPVLIDGAQSIQHMKIDVQELDCDFFVFSGHKLYGPTGIGVLYGKEKWLNQLPPYRGGGGMIGKVSFEGSTWADLPGKFEAGTPNYVGAAGLGEAINYVNNIGISNIGTYENELINYANAKLLNVPGLKIYGESAKKSGAISFLLRSEDTYSVGMKLDEMGIAVRTGHHCAQPLMSFYNIAGTVRASFAFYNTMSEIDILYEGLLKIANSKDNIITVKSSIFTNDMKPDVLIAGSGGVEEEISTEQVISNIIDDLAMFEEEGVDKTVYLEELAPALPLINDLYRTDQYLIEGCQSKVWLFAENINGRVIFTADSDKEIVKGLAAILIKILSNREPKQIIEFQNSAIDRIGLNNFITAKRGNGILAMLNQMRNYAMVFNMQMQKG